MGEEYENEFEMRLVRKATYWLPEEHPLDKELRKIINEAEWWDRDEEHAFVFEWQKRRRYLGQTLRSGSPGIR